METIYTAIIRVENFVRFEPGFSLRPLLELPEENDGSYQAEVKRTVQRVANDLIRSRRRDLLGQGAVLAKPFDRGLYDQVQDAIGCATDQQDWLRYLHAIEELASIGEAEA